MMLWNISFTDTRVIIVNAVLILFLVLGVYDGYKKGFLEQSVKLIGVVGALVVAYLLKDPISVLMYTHLPFFNVGGLFKGVSAINIVIYEIIAFIGVFVILLIVLKIICQVTKIVDHLLSLIAFIGVPNKILGAVMGFVESVIFLYFASFIFLFCANFFGFEVKPSFANDIVDLPILKNTFGSLLDSVDEIASMAKEYEDKQDKSEFNYKTMEILMKYDIISEENVKILIDSSKLELTEEQVNSLLDEYDSK